MSDSEDPAAQETPQVFVLFRPFLWLLAGPGMLERRTAEDVAFVNLVGFLALATITVAAIIMVVAWI